MGSTLVDVGCKYAGRGLVYAVCNGVYWFFKCGFHVCINDGVWSGGPFALSDVSVSPIYLLHTNWISAHMVDSCEGKEVYVGGCSLSCGAGLYRRIAGKPCKSKGFSLVLKKIRLIL